MFKALLLVLALLLIASVGILFSQHSITSTRTTLRERLQYMEAAAETEIANVVVRVADAGATTQPPRKALQRRRVTASSTDSSSSSSSAAQPLASSPPPTESPPPPSPPPPLECPGRRPYHVLLTAASGIYQQWQSRIMYWQYKKLKAEDPCSDLGGFTRLLNTRNSRPDGLMHEIPTIVVGQLGGGRCDECDHGFIVMNRPWGLRQFVRHPAFATIKEEYLFIVETDHLLLKPLKNSATDNKPIGFGFYYMTYKYDPPKLRPVIAKYHDPEKVDAVGPSPVVISKATLAKLVDPWWEMCLTLKRDRQADAAFGWVLEMWGYALTAARMGIRHTVMQTLQAEPGGVGIPSLDPYYIYHYTFDLDLQTRTDIFGRGKREHWGWSKRRFMGNYPPRLDPPKQGVSSSVTRFAQIMNGAIDAIRPWAAVRE